MIGDWTQEVQCEYVGSDARFDFPVRPLGWGKLMGLFMVGFGLLFVWGPAHTALEFGQKWRHGEADVGNVIFCLFPFLFVVAGFVPLAIGLQILFGRTRVEWKEGQLRSAEVLGPFRWTRRMPSKPVRKLEVSSATSQSGNAPPKQMDKFSTLVAVYEDGSKKLVAMGYPKDWLVPLAQQLTNYVGGGAPSTPVRVEVVESSVLDEENEDVKQQPEGSKVQVQETATGLTLTVPPAGIWRGSMGLLLFAIAWCCFMAVFTVAVGSSGFKAEGEVWIPVLFLLAFWGIGLGLLATAINMGMRSATLVVEGGVLRVTKKGLFGVKQLEWGRGDLSAVRAYASGMEVNNRPVIELQIHPVAGKKVGLLAGRKEEELRWMATLLRRVLKVSARPAKKEPVNL